MLLTFVMHIYSYYQLESHMLPTHCDRLCRDLIQTRKKAQNQDNSSTQQMTTLESSPSYAANQSISKSPPKAAIETVDGLKLTLILFFMETSGYVNY